MPIPARVAQWNKVGLNRVVRHIAPWMPGLGLVVYRDETRGGIRAPHRYVLRLIGVADFLSLKQRAARRALTDRILNGEGTAPRDLRTSAFDNEGLPPPLDALLGKVATTPTEVTDADFAAAQAAGFSEDQLFELVVCAAVGQSSRLCEAGLTALDQAAGSREEG